MRPLAAVIRRRYVSRMTEGQCPICGSWPAPLRPAMRRAVSSLPLHGACELCYEAFARNLVELRKARQRVTVGQGPPSTPNHAGWPGQRMLPQVANPALPVHRRPRLTFENVLTALLPGFLGLLVYLFFFAPL